MWSGSSGSALKRRRLSLQRRKSRARPVRTLHRAISSSAPLSSGSGSLKQRDATSRSSPASRRASISRSSLCCGMRRRSLLRSTTGSRSRSSRARSGRATPGPSRPRLVTLIAASSPRCGTRSTLRRIRRCAIGARLRQRRRPVGRPAVQAPALPRRAARLPPPVQRGTSAESRNGAKRRRACTPPQGRATLTRMARRRRRAWRRVRGKRTRSAPPPRRDGSGSTKSQRACRRRGRKRRRRWTPSCRRWV